MKITLQLNHIILQTSESNEKHLYFTRLEMILGAGPGVNPRVQLQQLLQPPTAANIFPGSQCVCVSESVKCAKPAVESFPTVRAHSLLPPLRTTMGRD